MRSRQLRRFRAGVVCGIAIGALSTAGARAQDDFPGGKPIEMTVLFPAGTSADVTAHVLAAHGYPDTPRIGDVITGLPQAGADYHVFHSATALNGAAIVANGGRVLCVTALGHNVKTAQHRAYEIARQISFAGMQMRRDIGYRAIQHQRR